jgi:poly-gamma-glutamate synthesis protein (capsule biosynthesis protein)
MKTKTNIIICGDICPTEDTKHLFENNDAKALFNNTLPILKNADVLIGNMEFVLTDNGIAATKTGPILKGPKSFATVFKDIGFTALGLANNHIKDCGTDGVLSSLQTCSDYNIRTVGAGENENNAKKPIIIEKNGWKIGLMAFAEHEFNAAYENEPGANLLDVFSDFDHIQNFKKTVDYLIILYHGGIEYYEYPSPLLQKKCRKMIDSGADYITCQHSHLIGTEEVYNNGTILYGQGNTVFGYRANNPSWNQGLIINIELDKDIKITNLPIEAQKTGIALANNQEKEQISKEMNTRKEKIKEKHFILNSWNTYCESKRAHIIPHLFGLGRITNKANRILKNKIISLLYSKKKHMITHNLTRCESHLEVIQTILNNTK